jgi:hypothetical protein
MTEVVDVESSAGKKRKADEASAEPDNKHPKRYILAVDIERTGKAFKYGVWAVGACFGTDDGQVLEVAQYACHKEDVVDYDPETWSDFWVKFPEIRRKINSFAVKDPIGEFHNWLVQLQEKYGPFGRKYNKRAKLTLASDNPAYDFGHLMVEFAKKGFERGIAEMFDDYVSTEDPSEQDNALLPDERVEVQASLAVPHSHEPIDDAMMIFQQLVGVRKVLAKRTSASTSSVTQQAPTTTGDATITTAVRTDSDSDYA